MKIIIPISKKEIFAFVLACRQLGIVYLSMTKVSSDDFITYELTYKSAFDLFQLGAIFQINSSRSRTQ